VVGVALLAAPAHSHSPASQCGQQHRFANKFSERTWAPKLWRRGSPSSKVLAAKRRQLSRARGCGYRGDLKAKWAKDRRRYGRYRELRQIAPYPGHGEWWSVPYAIVYCESGTSGLWSARNPSGAEGPYQLLDHGQPWPVTSWHDKMQHHRIAAQLYAESGTAPWVSSEGCWG
jgi:hypothetical protein